MKSAEKKEMQATAVEAAKAAGAIMSRNHFAAKKINESAQRDAYKRPPRVLAQKS